MGYDVISVLGIWLNPKGLTTLRVKKNIDHHGDVSE